MHKDYSEVNVFQILIHLRHSVITVCENEYYIR